MLRGDGGAGEPERGPKPAAPPEGSSSGPASRDVRHPTRSPAKAPPSADALWSAEEDLPIDRKGTIRTASVSVPVAPDREGAPTASGEALRDALLRVEGLLLRWQDAEVRAGWLSEPALAVPPDADSGIAGTGAPLHVLVGFLDQSPAYSVRLDPPLLLVGREGWSPTAAHKTTR